jgi:hypothetical protein
MRRIVFVLMMLIPSLIGSPVLGQSALVRALDSSDPLARAAAFGRLQSTSGGLEQPGIPEMLLKTLERENALMIDVLRQSNGEHGVSDKYGEDYSEYVGELADECFARCDRTNPRTLAALVGGAYNGGSKFVKNLVRVYGARLVPPLIEQAHSDVTAVRHQAVQTLGTLVAAGAVPSADMQTVHRTVVSATEDATVLVRQMAVRTLGEIGDATDLPLLRRIAAQDDGTYSARGVTQYPVRDEAVNAIARVQSRGRR